MCTLIIHWDPGTETPLLIGANRDERKTRVSEPFAFRKNIFCPLDVRGGTWIGISSQGIFSALTNLDKEEPPDRGRKSRGFLVSTALKQPSLDDAVTSVIKMLMQDIYNAFNLIIASEDKLIAIIGHGASRKIELIELSPGLHIVTGWGIDLFPKSFHAQNNIPNSNVRREMLIHDNFDIENFNVFSNQEELKRLLSLHHDKRDTNPEWSVCVHGNESEHVTVSSCIVIVNNDNSSGNNKKWNFAEIEHTERSPCISTYWNRSRIYFD